jgi:hypothetical protein
VVTKRNSRALGVAVQIILQTIQSAAIASTMSVFAIGEVKVLNTYSKSENGAASWTVWINEDAVTLHKLNCVEYVLPPTFRNNVQRKCDSTIQGGFPLTQSSSGEFTILLKLEWRDGHISTQQYPLNLHSVPIDMGTPIAVDSTKSSNVYVLSSDGTVIVLRETPTGLGESRRFRMIGVNSVTDLTSSKSDEVESVFICSVTADGNPFISQYSAEGNLLKRWWLPHICNGLDFDDREHSIYFGSPTQDLFKINVRSGGAPNTIGVIRGDPRGLGSIAVDPINRRVYAADAAGGNVYAYNLATNQTRQIAQALRNAVLRVDPERGFLYISEDHLVSRQRTGVYPSTRETFTRSPRFKRLDGLASIPSGSLLVSDSSADCLFLLSSSGEVLSKYP